MLKVVLCVVIALSLTNASPVRRNRFYEDFDDYAREAIPGKRSHFEDLYDSYLSWRQPSHGRLEDYLFRKSKQVYDAEREIPDKEDEESKTYDEEYVHGHTNGESKPNTIYNEEHEEPIASDEEYVPLANDEEQFDEEENDDEMDEEALMMDEKAEEQEFQDEVEEEAADEPEEPKGNAEDEPDGEHEDEEDESEDAADESEDEADEFDDPALESDDEAEESNDEDQEDEEEILEEVKDDPKYQSPKKDVSKSMNRLRHLPSERKMVEEHRKLEKVLKEFKKRSDSE